VTHSVYHTFFRRGNTCGTTSISSSEEGVVNRVGHVETVTGVVKTTPIRKVKRCVT